MENERKRKSKALTLKICTVAVFCAANIALSSFGIPVQGGHLYLNDAVIASSALFLDPLSSFFVGGIGAFFGDLIFYPTPMFVSLVTHGAQAVAISLLSGRGKKQVGLFRAIMAVIVGAVIMVTGYSLGRAFVYATPAAAIAKLPYQILQAAVGALFSIFICYLSPIKKQIAIFRGKISADGKR